VWHGRGIELCEVEPLADYASIPIHGRWFAFGALGRIEAIPPEIRPHLVRWVDGQGLQPTPPRRPAWERPGWFRQTSEWIEHQLLLRGYPITSPIEQYKAAWPWSSILRVQAGGKLFYCKQTPDGVVGEADVIGFLARRWADRCPEVIARTDDGRCMLL